VKPLLPWQRNLAAAWFAQLLAAMGFSCALPFLPLYVQELGITEPHEVETWAGLLAFAAGLSMAASAPIWGALADRYGRKSMVLRASFGGAVLVAAMGLVGDVQQLLVLRFLQGTVTGVSSASNTLVASLTPRGRLGFALGAMQMSMYVGMSLGPLAGGLIADHVGFRPTFFLTGAMLALGGLVVLFFVEEHFQRPPSPTGKRRLMFGDLGTIARQPALLVFISVVFSIQASNMMVSPIFPLFIQEISPSEGNIASTVGLILGVAGAVSAVSALAIGRVSDRLGHRRVLAICGLGAGLSYMPQAFSADPTQALVWRAALGLFAGGMLPSVNALIALRAPASGQGAAFGLSATAAALGNALGPLGGASQATALGLRSVFISAALLLLLTGGGASLLRATAEPKPTPPTKVVREA